MPQAALAETPRPPIQKYLSAKEIKRLRGDYTRKEMDDIFRSTLPRIYAPSHQYLDAISDGFLGNLPSDKITQGRKTLSIQDRERCIIALLAARGEDFTLGLHIYVALMEGISAEEIANIILLAGIYTGVDNLSRGLLTAVNTLTTLKGLLTGAAGQLKGTKAPPAPISAATVVGTLQQKLSR